MQAKMKAAIYCRVAQKDDWAIEQQLQTMRRFAAAQGYEDCAEYLDNGASGLTLDRLALSRLNEAMANEEINIVFVTSTSRIGRDMFSVFSWMNYAEMLGVEIVSQSEDIPHLTASLTALTDEFLKKRKRK